MDVCGSAAGVLEGQIAIKTSGEALRNLSPQQLVDCARTEGSLGW